MAKLSAHGTELGRLFNPKTGSLIVFMSDGWIMRKTLADRTWRQWERFKEQAKWIRDRLRFGPHAGIWVPAEHIHQPSLKMMERWAMDGVAEATDGCRVEPDGQCPHGFQSWLIIAGII